MKTIKNNSNNLILKISIFCIILTIPFYCWSDDIIHDDESVKNELRFKQSCQFEKDIDSIIVLYWNAWGNNYDQYTFSYSLMTEEMVVYVEYLKNYPKYCIDSLEQKKVFLFSVYDFYLKKTIPIIEKKIKHHTDEYVEYDIPTFHVECYNNGKRVLFSSTQLENGDYELVFHPKFEEFKKMIFSIVKEYDKFVKNRKSDKNLYRSKYY